MGLPGFWFRATVRRRWVGYVTVVVLIAVMGGLALLGLAGARRTQSAYPRFLRSVDPSTMAVDTGAYDPERVAAIASLTGVKRSQVYVAPLMARIEDGRPRFDESFEALASLDGRFFDQDRFTPTAGRLARAGRVEEIVVNEVAAEQFGYRVGQVLQLGTWDPEVIDDDFFQKPAPPALMMKATVVGIGVFPNEVLQDDTDRSPLMLLTPAYTQRALPYVQYEWQGLELRNGDADIPAVKRRVGSLLGGGTAFFRQTSFTTFHTQQAVRPVSLSLGLFGAIAFVACVVLAGQILVRQLQEENAARAVLRALGTTPGASVAAAGFGPILAVLAGSLLAAIVAVAGSPVMPIGRVRAVEVNRGFDADWVVLGFGVFALVVVLTATVLVAAWRAAPHRGDLDRGARMRPSRLVGTAESSGFSPAAVAGIRLAVERGHGRTAVPVRSVIGGVALAVLALVAAVTFGSNLRSLIDEPRLYGWDWNATLLASAGYGTIRPDVAADVFGANPDIEAWSGAAFGSDVLDAHNVPLLGMDAGAPVHPPILEGRFLRSSDEIVLGSETLATLGKSVDDDVTIGTGATARRLRIVGVATLPTIGVVHGTYPSLGIGAIVAPDLVPDYLHSFEDDGYLGPNVVFVRTSDRDPTEAALEAIERQARATLDSEEEGIDLIPVQRPAEIVNADDIGRAPLLMAIALVLAALVALGAALAASVRRRRHDLALLKTLGFTRSQVGATVCWQGVVTVAIGLLVGLPLGVIAGRLLWTEFADALNVVPDSATPWLALLAVAASILVIGVLAAVVPARAARRLPPATVLRTE